MIEYIGENEKVFSRFDIVATSESKANMIKVTAPATTTTNKQQ